MVRYPVVLEDDDNDTVLVSFPDFPEAHTFGDTKEDALARAVDALETVIDAYIRDRRPIPAPSEVRADSVFLPALVGTKVQIYEAMRAARVNKSELARRLHVHMPQVDRLLDVRHGSKLEQLEAAARALGGRLDVSLVDLPSTAATTIDMLTAARATQARRRQTAPPRMGAMKKAAMSRQAAGKKR